MRKQAFREVGSLSKVNSNYLAVKELSHSWPWTQEYYNASHRCGDAVHIVLKWQEFLILSPQITLLNSRQGNQQVQTRSKMPSLFKGRKKTSLAKRDPGEEWRKWHHRCNRGPPHSLIATRTPFFECIINPLKKDEELWINVMLFHLQCLTRPYSSCCAENRWGEKMVMARVIPTAIIPVKNNSVQDQKGKRWWNS